MVAAANPLRSLDGDAASVSDLIRTVEGPVVLVAHSYGGAVISNVAADAGESTRPVEVNGFAPDPGESCLSLARRFEACPGRVTLVRDELLGERNPK